MFYGLLSTYIDCPVNPSYALFFYIFSHFLWLNKVATGRFCFGRCDIDVLHMPFLVLLETHTEILFIDYQLHQKHVMN